MKINKIPDSDLLVIAPRIFTDDRGTFSETFNEAQFRLSSGLNITFVQDNESISKKNVFRGFHFQVPPKSQAKLVRVVKGAIIDFAIDIRKSSPQFGKVFSIELNDTNKLNFFIPEGYAHGFLSLEENTIVNYKCSQYYSPDSERCLTFNDSDLEITWPVDLNDLIISNKDLNGEKLIQLQDIFM
jgi:dTDP-4-dehydrorhamnose 3,5-epimerase